MNKVGIFSGSFDPVHTGHIAFALKAITDAKLDQVLFVPEAKPRRKDGVAHLGHRIAMLRLALADHSQLGLLELPDKQFTVLKTLPRIEAAVPNSELYLLFGSDVLEHLHNWSEWPHADKLLQKVGLIIGVRHKKVPQEIQHLIDTLPETKHPLKVILSPSFDVSSRGIREAIQRHEPTSQLQPSVRQYINEHWLYASATPNNS